MYESKWKCLHCLYVMKRILDGHEKIRYVSSHKKKFSLVGLAHSLEWKFRVSTWPLTSPIWLWLLNIYYSYHIQVKGNTWDKLSPLIVIIIAWRSSIKDGILGVGAGGGGGGFSYLPRPWVERTIKTLWIKSVTSSQEKSSRHSKFWGTLRMICV